MNGFGRAAVLVGSLATVHCGLGAGPLPRGATLGGYADVEEPESYSVATLYAYMNGGAEVYREYGVAALHVRRYRRGTERLMAELFEMSDTAAAAALYSYARRPGRQSDIAAGCRGDVAPAEVLVAKGRHFLVCRNEDPLAKDGSAVRDLCGRLAVRLAGDCGVGALFDGLPREGRVTGSEVALRGPLGPNLRPWLSSLGREGFERGWLASYIVPGGEVQTLLGEYASAERAEQGVATLATSAPSELRAGVRGRRVVVVRPPPGSDESAETLAQKLLALP